MPENELISVYRGQHLQLLSRTCDSCYALHKTIFICPNHRRETSLYAEKLSRIRLKKNTRGYFLWGVKIMWRSRWRNFYAEALPLEFFITLHEANHKFCNISYALPRTDRPCIVVGSNKIFIVHLYGSVLLASICDILMQ